METPRIDVVVVSYRSRSQLRGCVERLAGCDAIHVVVVDNASGDGSLETVADLPVSAVQLPENRGFAAGCNAGWLAGESPYVLFLNPDARIDVEALSALAEVLDSDHEVGAAGPKIVDGTGHLDFSQRRFPRLRSTYARALFLHRVFPRATWVDEMIRDPERYERGCAAEWLSGACLLVRRSLLEQLAGWDDSFFLYCEDKDLCKRVWRSGYEVRYIPEAVCFHIGGASAPRPSLLPILAASRLRYARKHFSLPAVLLDRVGLIIEALLRLAVASGGTHVRAGHARALKVLATGR